MAIQRGLTNESGEVKVDDVGAEEVSRTSAAAASLVASDTEAYLYRLRVTNGASAQYIQVHVASEVPNDGVPPQESFYVAANGVLDIPFDKNHYMNGIVVCNSSTLATKTIGAADCWFAVEFTRA